MVSHVCLALCLGSWFMVLDLANVNWHVPFDPRYCHFVTVQLGKIILQFMVLLFDLNTAPCIFIKMTKPLA